MTELEKENRFMFKILLLYLFGIIMFLIGYNAHACGDLPPPDTVTIQVTEAV